MINNDPYFWATVKAGEQIERIIRNLERETEPSKKNDPPFSLQGSKRQHNTITPLKEKPVYKNLEKEMEEKGITEFEMADMAGIPRDVFHYCFRGKIPFRYFYCNKIKDILETQTPLEVLFHRKAGDE